MSVEYILCELKFSLLYFLKITGLRTSEREMNGNDNLAHQICEEVSC